MLPPENDDEQMFEALREAGYALDTEFVGVLRTGLGMDSDGKVDLVEFMGMCEDIASNQVPSLLPKAWPRENFPSIILQDSRGGFGVYPTKKSNM